MTKKLFVITLGLAVIGLSLYFAQPTNAQNPVTSLIERIAEKFNLNKDDVQKTVEEFRTEKMNYMQTERKANLEEKLTQAVADGKISETQKQTILKKMDELKNHRETHRTDMEAWMKQNGLEGKFFGFGMGKTGMGRGMHFWN